MTAMVTGYKACQGSLSVNHTSARGDFSAADTAAKSLKTILEYAADSGRTIEVSLSVRSSRTVTIDRQQWLQRPRGSRSWARLQRLARRVAKPRKPNPTKASAKADGSGTAATFSTPP